MSKKRNQSIFILVSILVILTLLCVVLAEDLGSQKATITETDNQPYSGEDKIVSQESASPDMEPWLLGKIEPAVEQESQTNDVLNVIVYVKSLELEDISNGVKAPFKVEMESLRQRIRQINRQYRSGTPVPAEHEKFALATQQFMMTEEDRSKLVGLRSELDNKLDQMRREIGAAIKNAVRPDLDIVENFIAASGGEITARITITPAIGAAIPVDFLQTLAGHPLVLAVMKDHPVEYELDLSVPSVGYDTWWNGSPAYTGGTYDFGIVDTGVRESHPAFAGINFAGRPGHTVASDHGTHVTGIVASANSVFCGGAYGLDTIIWTRSGRFSAQTVTMENMEWMATSATQGPEVINHSPGFGNTTGTDYTNNDAFYDAFIHRYEIMVTKSAGNNDWSYNDPTLTRPAPAYNLIAVANMDDQNTTNRIADVRNTSSSIGPTLNGRKKPDITAPGTNIMSTNSDWSTENDFRSESGTSMAAPHVAAAIVLMENAGNHIPMAQKAVLINTADAWTCNGTETTADDTMVSGSHWDWSYGWGYLDMDEAHFNRDDYFVDSVVPNNYNATPDDYKLYRGHMFDNDKATLVWEKRADYIAGDPPTTQYNLSDIDISIYNENGGLLLGGDNGSKDNVHQVAVNDNYDVVIKVYAYDTSFDGADSESYALATEENFQQASPPAFEITYTMPTSVDPGSTFSLTVNVKNIGEVTSNGNNDVTLTLPGGFSIISGANPRTLGAISAGATSQAAWSIQASSTAGTYSFSATNSTGCYSETYTGTGQDSIDVGYYSLSNDSPVSFSTIPKGFCFELKSVDWACVGINPSTDHDVQTDDNSGFSSPYQNSSASGTARDFVVINGHSWGSTRHYAQVYYGSASTYTVEAQWEAYDLSVGSAYSDSMPSDNVHEIYEVELPAADKYKVTVHIISGSADLAVYIFKPTRDAGGRINYDWMVDDAGAGGDESMTFYPDTAGYYGIAVINENASSANYTITVEKVMQQLKDDTPATLSTIPMDFDFEIKSHDWCGIAINPSTDHDIKVDNDPNLSSPYQSSTYTGTTRDFVVTNGHNWGNVTHYAQVYFSPASSYTIEAQWDAYDLSVSSTGYSDDIGSGEVIQMYEVPLTTGNTYDVTVDITSNNADLAVYVFEPTRNSGRRIDFDWMANGAGAGGDEQLSFDANTTGDYGIAVINENAKSANYTIKVEKQVAESLPDDETEEHDGNDVPGNYSFQVKNYDWGIIAMRPQTDMNLCVFDSFDFNSSYSCSTSPAPNVCDFVLVNGHYWGYATHYAEVSGTPGSYSIEAQWEAYDLTPSSEHEDFMDYGELVQTYEARLVQGRTYDVELNVLSGDANLAIYGYEPNQTSANRQSTPYFYADDANSGGSELISCVGPNETGHYAIAVINENGGEANYTITVVENVGDFNGDCIKDLADLGLFCEQWLSNSLQADFNYDGLVNFVDFACFVSGAIPPQPMEEK
ncbi:MAG: S8 family serine peptidase [Planctomycetota bacterium]|jgi:serine protease AprX